MKYPGAELDNFDKAVIWRKYIFLQIKKFIKGDVLEVGAGIGSFTNNYKNIPNQITLSEVDKENLLIIKDRFKNTNFNYTSEITKNIKKKFDSIMYLNVLEHIKNDNEEVLNAFEKKCNLISQQQLILRDERITIKKLKDILLPKIISGKFKIPSINHKINEVGI